MHGSGASTVIVVWWLECVTPTGTEGIERGISVEHK